MLVGRLGDQDVAFLPRHGPGHVIPPHRINFRANVWALKELGVTRIFGPCAVGSLRADIAPTHFVVCDQLVDRTYGRADTYFDGPVVNHVSFADPYCPELRGVALAACEAEDVTVHAAGTIVVDPGAPLLDPGREPLVPRRRLGRDRHDPVPRGLPRP